MSEMKVNTNKMLNFFMDYQSQRNDEDSKTKKSTKGEELNRSMSFSDDVDDLMDDEEGTIGSMISPVKPLKTLSSTIEQTVRSDSHSSSNNDMF
jgi:hypothetical protein